ncbi:hypothetical protein JCM5350_004320 [Sporobolomyces pararoseus]
MSDIVYRDRDITTAEQHTAQRAVSLYRQFFDQNIDSVHEDWKHDWPTGEEIENNYLVHERSFARDDMGVNVAIDVQGGPVRVNYRFVARGRRVHTPIEIYTRSERYYSTTASHQLDSRDREWDLALNKLRTAPPFLDVNEYSNQLPIDIAWPRHLETRNQRTYPTSGRLFPKQDSSAPNLDPFSMIRVYTDPRANKQVKVKLTQLNVEVPEGTLYSPPATNDDDRYDGAPSSMLKTYVLLEVSDHLTGHHEYSALLRIRIAEEEERGVKVGKKWYPWMAAHAHEGTPEEHRDGTLIRLGRRHQVAPSRQLQRPQEILPYPPTRPIRVPPTGSSHPSDPHYMTGHFLPAFPQHRANSLGIRHQGIYRQLSPASDRPF